MQCSRILLRWWVPPQANSIIRRITTMINPMLLRQCRRSLVLAIVAVNLESANALATYCPADFKVGESQHLSVNNLGIGQPAIDLLSQRQRQRSSFSQLMRYPLPESVPVTSPYGWRIHPISGQKKFHAGIDFGADHGTPVLAAVTGQVKYVGDLGGYGNVVLLEHNPQQQTLYAHLSETLVESGTWVQQGTVIGLVGSSGYATGPHLHFELRELQQGAWQAVDVAPYLGMNSTQISAK
jgi:murein DD-endopeptidase MepM/ murein hydrolase activator NlpD